MNRIPALFLKPQKNNFHVCRFLSNVLLLLPYLLLGFLHLVVTSNLVIFDKYHNSILICINFSEETPQQDSILNLKYGISGNRTVGAHAPILANGECSEEMVFKVALALQRPVLDPCVAVGFLPFSSDCLRVGQLVNVRWRIERLKNPETDVSASCRVSACCT